MTDSSSSPLPMIAVASSHNNNNYLIDPSASNNNNNNNNHNNIFMMEDHNEEGAKIIEYTNVDNLALDFEQLINSPTLSDVTFLVGSEQIHIYAHKVLLVQRSRYFRAMFLNSGFAESQQQQQQQQQPQTQQQYGEASQLLSNCCELVIDNFELPVFLKVIRFIYCGKVQFEQSYNTDAMNVLGAADYFQCEELKNYCVQHLQGLISEECALDLLHLANSFSCDTLIDTCFDFICSNTQEVLESEAFTQIDVHTLRLLLESEYLAIDEIHVFTALLKHTIMQMYEEIKESESTKSEKERRDDEEFIKKLFTKLENSTARKRSSLSRMARSSIGQYGSHQIPCSKRKKRDSFDKMPDVQIKRFNGGYEAFISNLGRALQGKYKERFKEIVHEHISLIRFPLMTAEQLTNIVEPLDIVPDRLMLEAYRFICATGINKPRKSTNSTLSPVILGNGSTSNSMISPKTIHSIRCNKRTGVGQHIEFDGSKILSEPHKRILNQWCEVGPNNRDKKKKKWVMAYSATRDGFSAAQFHKLCDNKGPSVTVARTTDGYIFGGYNSQSWSSTTCWKPATDTFLFSLVNPYNDGARKLKVKNNQRAVYNHASFGPTFGGGGNMSYFDPYDIYIDSSMKHGHTNVGNSYSTFRGGWRSDEAQRSLAGSLNSWVLNECEVFILQ